jgi:putative addiction module component (TIGR02574 family)
MTPNVDQLKVTLSHLTSPERAELAQFLLHSLEPVEEGAAAEWLALAERRMAEVRAGQVVGIPAEQLLKELREARR